MSQGTNKTSQQTVLHLFLNKPLVQAQYTLSVYIMLTIKPRFTNTP